MVTYACDEVFMRVDGLGAAPVLEVPNAQRLVVRAANKKFPARVEQHPSHPVVVPYLSGIDIVIAVTIPRFYTILLRY